MSAIARVMHSAGRRVTGSDQRESSVTAGLRELGLEIYVGHRASQIDGADAVIYSAAVPQDNVEVAAARERATLLLARGEALASLVANFKVIAVAGTHGKSTTAAMIATILASAGVDATWLIGADLADQPGGRLGTSDIAVVEADEAYGSFLHLRPDLAVITNIDADHLDHYGDLAGVEDAFRRFASASRNLIVCSDDAAASRVTSELERTTYGIGDADIQARNIRSDSHGTIFDLVQRDKPLCSVHLAVTGLHKVRNALGAAVATMLCGVSPESIAQGLSAFVDVGRRFEWRGSVGGADIIDDYAHHPTEISATLEAAHWGSWRRIVAVFQPHLYSRTLALAAQFGVALSQADVVVVTDVYGAREEPIPGVNGMTVVRAVCEAAPGKTVAYMPRLDEAAAYVRERLRDGDVILTMGAGDVTTLPDRILAGVGSGTT